MPRELARLKACCHESEGRVNANQCNCNALKNNERTAGFHWFVGQICFLSSLFQNAYKQPQYNRRRYTIKYKPSSVCDRTQSKVKPFLNNPTASREPHNCPRKVLHYYSSIIYSVVAYFSKNIFRTPPSQKGTNHFTMFGSIGLARDRRDLQYERHHHHEHHYCKHAASPPPTMHQPQHQQTPGSPMSKFMIMATSSMSSLMAPAPPLFREENKQDDSQHHH